KNIGGAISPFNAWLVIRGMKTLAVRMDRHNENAMAVAEYLAGHEKVDKVIYPGLPDYPQHEIARKQMCGSGGMVSFILKDARNVPVLLDSVGLCTLAVSLGETDTLIQHPATMTHAVVPPQERKRCGIVDGLVRLSVGIEDAADIITDIGKALDKIL
ncbi:MAG TPA: PLP-dependent transferase, partial [Candidatus Methanoperedens sp.]